MPRAATTQTQDVDTKTIESVTEPVTDAIAADYEKWQADEQAKHEAMRAEAAAAAEHGMTPQDLAKQLEELAKLRADLTQTLADIKASRLPPEERTAEDKAVDDLYNTPLYGETLPKRYYSPRYMHMRIRKPGSQYPIRFVNGEILVHTPEEDALVRSALGARADEFRDNMPSRERCPTCGFSSFSSSAWRVHITNGPHAFV